MNELKLDQLFEVGGPLFPSGHCMLIHRLYIYMTRQQHIGQQVYDVKFVKTPGG